MKVDLLAQILEKYYLILYYIFWVDSEGPFRGTMNQVPGPVGLLITDDIFRVFRGKETLSGMYKECGSLAMEHLNNRNRKNFCRFISVSV
jgi:hypothetical protein